MAINEIKIGNTRHPIEDTTAREHLVEVGSTQPVSEANKLWIKNQEQEYEVPTMADLENMLPKTVNVSGTTPAITGEADTRYICGEVSTLSVVAPESGCIDVIFTSGSTATILTVTSAKTGVTVKWANGFDPTSLEADTTYELNIADGEFGVVASWT